MKKIVISLLIAFVAFVILNFFYSNIGGPSFNYPVAFRFSIPYLPALESSPVPLGFLIIVAFCLGMVFLPILQLVPALFKNAAIRSREKKIRELERELEDVRSSSASTQDPASSSFS